MLLLLPSAWLACLLLFRELGARGRMGSDWRMQFVLATASWAALLTLGTEVLSLATELNFDGVAIYWVAVNVALWGGWVRWRKRGGAVLKGWTIADEWRSFKAWPVDARWVLGAAAVFAGFLGGIALLTPTTNWDSLTYHMARVMHWVQNNSVAHYPTNMASQIQMGPWAAFVQTHLWLLTGGDRFANLVQWASMIGCMVMATLLVRQVLPESSTVGRAQAFAALLVVTLPTGIVQSISTQTDYVTAFWLMSAASVGLAWCREPGNRVYAVGFGAVLGLGVLTKITYGVYGLPVGLAVAAVLIARQRKEFSKLVRPAAIALVVAAAIALPHLARNQALFGSSLGTQINQESHGIQKPTLAKVLSNVIRSAQLHSNTGIEPLTHLLNKLADTIQGWTGVRADDRELSSYAGMYQVMDEFFVFDSFAASPWHGMLIVVAIVVGLASAKKNQLPLLGLGLAFAGFLILCAMLRWQIWNGRYHLPVLVLCLPAVAVVLATRMNRWATVSVSVGLLVFAFVIVANNRSRPVFDAAWRAQPRLEQMFSFQGTKFYGPMYEAATQIARSNCRFVGLKLSPDDPEYPLWLLLRDAGFRGRLDHVLVDGPSAKLAGPTEMPDVIVTSLDMKPTGEMAAAYPTATEIGSKEGGPNLKLFWSAEVSAQRAQKK